MNNKKDKKKEVKVCYFLLFTTSIAENVKYAVERVN